MRSGSGGGRLGREGMAGCMHLGTRSKTTFSRAPHLRMRQGRLYPPARFLPPGLVLSRASRPVSACSMHHYLINFERQTRQHHQPPPSCLAAAQRRPGGRTGPPAAGVRGSENELAIMAGAKQTAITEAAARSTERQGAEQGRIQPSGWAAQRDTPPLLPSPIQTPSPALQSRANSLKLACHMANWKAGLALPRPLWSCLGRWRGQGLLSSRVIGAKAAALGESCLLEQLTPALEIHIQTSPPSPSAPRSKSCLGRWRGQGLLPFGMIGAKAAALGESCLLEELVGALQHVPHLLIRRVPGGPGREGGKRGKTPMNGSGIPEHIQRVDGAPRRTRKMRESPD
jgi:hypothetical protein